MVSTSVDEPAEEAAQEDAHSVPELFSDLLARPETVRTKGVRDAMPLIKDHLRVCLFPLLTSSTHPVLTSCGPTGRLTGRDAPVLDASMIAINLYMLYVWAALLITEKSATAFSTWLRYISTEIVLLGIAFPPVIHPTSL